MNIARFEDIESWKAARQLTKRVYELTRGRQFNQDDDLRRQMRRASSSVMSNIAEGFDSGSDWEFRRYLRIARKSTNELQSDTYIVRDQVYWPEKLCDEIYADAGRVKRLISGFIKYLGRARRVTGDR